MHGDCGICLQTVPNYPYCSVCSISLCPACAVKICVHPSHHYRGPQCRQTCCTLWKYSIALLDTATQEVQHYCVAALINYRYDCYPHVSMDWDVVFKHMTDSPERIVLPIVPWENVTDTQVADYKELRNTRFASYILKNDHRA